jgi:hypothetical protein
MDKVQEVGNPNCNTRLSEPFGLACAWKTGFVKVRRRYERGRGSMCMSVMAKREPIEGRNDQDLAVYLIKPFIRVYN